MEMKSTIRQVLIEAIANQRSVHIHADGEFDEGVPEYMGNDFVVMPHPHPDMIVLIKLDKIGRVLYSRT